MYLGQILLYKGSLIGFSNAILYRFIHAPTIKTSKNVFPNLLRKLSDFEEDFKLYRLINRPGVAGAVLQSPPSLTN